MRSQVRALLNAEGIWTYSISIS